MADDDSTVSSASDDKPVMGADGFLTHAPSQKIFAKAPEEAASAYMTQGGTTTYEDYLRSAGAGVVGMGASLTGALKPFMANEDVKRDLQASVERQQDTQKSIEEGMTPAAKQPGFFSHPMVSLAGAAPSVVGLAGAEMVGGPMAAAGLASAMSVGDTENRAAAAGGSATLGELATAAGSGAATMLLPGVGPLAKIATGNAAKRVLMGGGRDAVIFGAGAGVEEAVGQHAEQRLGKREGYDPSAIAGAATEQLGPGMAMGGFHGLVHGRAEKPADDLGKKQIDKHDESEAKAGGQANQVGSDREAKKPEAQKGAAVTPGVTTPEGGFEEIPGTGMARTTPPDPNRATGPAPPADPSADPAVAMAAKGQGAKTVDTPPPTPGEAAPTAAPAPTKGPAAKKPPGTPPTPDMVRQREEVLDKNHPRDVMLYPPGTEVPPVPKDLTHSWGTFNLGDDYGTLFYDRNLKGGSGISGPKILRHREAGTDYDFVNNALKQAHERSAAFEAAKTAKEAPPETAPETVTPPESQEAPPPLETPQEPQGAPLAAEERPPATPVAAEAGPPSEAAPEAPRAEPAAVAEPAGPQPRVGRDQTKGFKALVDELNATKQTASPEEAAWLGQFGVGRREDGSYGTVEAGKLEKVGEAAQAKVAIREEEAAKAAGRAAEAKKPGEEVPAKVPEEMKVTPGVSEKPRILEAKLTPEEQEAHKGAALKAKAAAKEALKKAEKEAKKQARIQKEVETGEAQKAESHKGKKAEEAREENNQKAREVVMRHLPKGDETPQEQHARAQAMMKDAVESGVHIPDKFKGQHGRSDDVILLAEARARIGKGKGDNNAFKRFKDREAAYYKEAGKIGEIRRTESGELGAKGSKAKPEEGKEEAIPEAGALETHVEEPEDKIEAEKAKLAAEAEDARLRAEQAAHEAKVGKEAEPKKEELIGPVQEYKPEVAGAAKEAPKVTGKEKLAALRPKVEGKVTLGGKKGEALKEKAAEKRAETSEEIAARHKEAARELPKVTADATATTVRAYDQKSRAFDVNTLQSGTVRSLVGKYFNLKHYSSELHELVQKIHDKVMEIAGDVEMHFVSEADMQRIAGDARGVHVWGLGGKYHKIFINAEHFRADTPFHEGFHGATKIAIRDNPRLKALVDELRKEVLLSPEMAAFRERYKADRRSDPLLQQAFSNVDEFITTMMTRPEVQDMLKHVKISKDLANRIGVPSWRRMSAWEGFMAGIRQVFNLGPRETNAIEAITTLTERTFLKHPSQAGELSGYVAKLHEIEAREGPIAHFDRLYDSTARAEDEASSVEKYRDLGVRVVQNAWQNATAKLHKVLPKIMNGVQLAHYYSKLFTDKGGNNIIEHIMEIGRRMNKEMNALRDNDLETYLTSRINAEKFANRQGDYAKLWEMSNKYDIDASKPPPAPRKKPESVAMENSQSSHFHPEAHKLFNSLPEEMKKQYVDEMKFFQEKSKAMAEQRLDGILDNNPLPAGVKTAQDKADLKERFLKGELTDKESEHYYNLKMLPDMTEARSLMAGKRVYAPAYRSGDFVVKGRYEMPDGGHTHGVGVGGAQGEELPDHVRQFDTRKEQHEYMIKTELHATPDIVYYAKDTGERLLTALEREKARDAARGGDANVVKRFEVQLQRQHMEMHKTYSDAKQALDAMREGGVKELSGVLDRRQEGDWGKINSEHAAAMERNINHRTDLSPQEKKAAIKAMRDYELVHGSALKSHLVTRRFVGGAEYGHADAIRSYSEAANRHMVNVKLRPEMDAAMKRAEEMDAINSRDPDKSYQSAAVMNELRDRVYRDPDALSYKNAPWINRLMALSYLKYMFGPRHMMMLQTHPLVYSAPEMAGRHGTATVLAAMRKAAADTGGVFYGAKEGLKATGRAAKAFKRGLTPEQKAELSIQPDVTKQMISRLEGHRRQAMENLNNSGELHSGYTDEFYAATGMDKVDAFFRQQSRAQDAQNRVLVGLSAYDVEYAKTGDEKASEAYAKKVIQKTIGVNSAMDMGSAMSNPLVRSFMQYKHFPIRQAELMLQNTWAAFKGESKEVQREAMRSALYQASSSFTFAGVHGLPIGFLKIAGVIGGGLGLTPSPTEIDDKTRRMLAGVFGPTIANVVLDGVLSAVPHAPNLNNMVSRDTDWAFGDVKHGDLPGFLINDIGGAPLSVLADGIKGVQAFVKHDWTRAASDLPFLPRTVGDLFKAYDLATAGATTVKGKQLTPASYIDAGWRALGFGTEQEMKAQAGRTAAEAAVQNLPKKPQTRADELKAKARAARNPDVLGITPTKRSQQLLKQYQEVYQ